MSGSQKDPIGPALQWALPAALRLDEEPLSVALPDDPLAALTSAGNLYLKARRSPDANAAQPASALLVDLAVELWRLERRIDAARSEISEPNRRALESSATRLRNVLDRAKIEWRDATGEAYSDGMRSVRVLAFEPTADIAAGERRIIETVRPAVYVDGRIAAVGEVVVGTAIEEKGEGYDPADD